MYINLIKIFILFVTIFTMYFGEAVFCKNSIVLRVDDKIITRFELVERYKVFNLINRNNQQKNISFDEKLLSNIKAMMIDEVILGKIASSLRITVSNQEVEESIKNFLIYFQKENKNLNNLNALCSFYKIDPSTVQYVVYHELVLKKLIDYFIKYLNNSTESKSLFEKTNTSQIIQEFNKYKMIEFSLENKNTADVFYNRINKKDEFYRSLDLENFLDQLKIKYSSYIVSTKDINEQILYYIKSSGANYGYITINTTNNSDSKELGENILAFYAEGGMQKKKLKLNSQQIQQIFQKYIIHQIIIDITRNIYSHYYIDIE